MDVRLVERLGVRFVFDTAIGIDIPFDDLQRDYDAIAITAGAMNPVYLDVPGADLDGVKYGVDFMKKANLGPAARGRPQRRRHRRRLHRDGLLAHEPPLRRRERDHRLPPHPLRARRRRGGAGRDRARGRRLEFLVSPIELIGEDGKLTGVRFIRNKLGEPDASGRRSPVPIEGSEFVVPADTVIPAVSQAADLTFLPVEANFEVNRGRIKVDPATYATNVRGVFACGDFVTGPTTLIESRRPRQEGRLRDRPLPRRPHRRDGHARTSRSPSSWRHDMPEFYDVLPRQHIPMVPARGADAVHGPDASTSRPRSSWATTRRPRWPSPPAA